MMSFRLIIPLLLLLLCSHSRIEGRSKYPDNFHQVDSELYRSGQPKGKDYTALKQLGIKSVINLREKRMSEKAEDFGLHYIHIPLETDQVTAADIVKVMKAIHEAPKPILIHCRRGSDRTGCMVAAYRIVFNNWNKEAALSEMCDKKYAYLEKLFPKLKQLILTCDEAPLRNQVLE